MGFFGQEAGAVDIVDDFLHEDRRVAFLSDVLEILFKEVGRDDDSA